MPEFLLLGAVGNKKGRGTPFQSHKTIPKIAMGLVLCNETAGMNEVAAERSNEQRGSDATARRAKSCWATAREGRTAGGGAGFKSHFPGGRKESLQLGPSDFSRNGSAAEKTRLSTDKLSVLL